MSTSNGGHEQIGSFSLTCGVALAQSSGSHGDGLIIVDGKNRIADPYLTSKFKTESFTIGDKLEDALTNISQFLPRRHIRTFDGTDIFEQDILNRKTKYLFTDQLPCNDLDGLKSVTNQKITTFACTQNKITYINKSLFEQLNVRDQALGIIHERIHAFYPDHPHYLIANFVGGLDLALKIRDQQRLGKREMLTLEEVERLKNMQTSALELGIGQTIADAYTVHRFGGGLSEKELGDSVFLSVDSYLEFSESKMDISKIVNVEIINSVIIHGSDTYWGGNCNVTNFNNSKIINSSINGCFEISNSTITNSKMSSCSTIGSTVDESDLSESEIVSSKFEKCGGIFTADNAICTESRGIAAVSWGHMTKTRVHLEKDAKLIATDFYLSGTYDEIFLHMSSVIEGLHLSVDSTKSNFKVHFNANQKYQFNPGREYHISSNFPYPQNGSRTIKSEASLKH